MAVQDWIKSLDLFGNPVMMTYNGKTKFSSFAGGCATLTTILLCVYWWLVTYLNY
jgi:hypothetical protein